ncbi:MAG TPA: PilN domain-containing protein [Thermoanaerobaculia bacterium]
MSVPAERPAPPTPPAAARPLAPSERREPLNLARRPFTNSRPVVRAAVLLWLLGLLLLLGNVALFWGYLSGSAEKREELARLEQQVERERQTIRNLESRVEGLDLEQQNRQVRYLNRKIAQRTFSWSLLFDRVAETLPDQVRLVRLTPTGMAEDSEKAVLRDEEEEGDDQVRLTISGVAKSDEALLQFVDNLFAHPAFDEPDWPRDTREEDTNQVRFDLTVTYLPGDTTSQDVVVVEEEAPPTLPGGLAPPPQQPPAAETPEGR